MSKVGLGAVPAGAAGACVLALALVAVTPLAGCGGEEREAGTPPSAPTAPKAEAEAPEPAEAISLAEAQQVFQSRCSSCHGAQGAGDGPASLSLVPKPRNFHESEWQQSVTDQHIESVIAYGGAAVGKSAIMPGHPDLANQPAVLAGLVNYVRSLKD